MSVTRQVSRFAFDLDPFGDGEETHAFQIPQDTQVLYAAIEENDCAIYVLHTGGKYASDQTRKLSVVAVPGGISFEADNLKYLGAGTTNFRQRFHIFEAWPLAGGA